MRESKARQIGSHGVSQFTSPLLVYRNSTYWYMLILIDLLHLIPPKEWHYWHRNSYNRVSCRELLLDDLSDLPAKLSSPYDHCRSSIVFSNENLPLLGPHFSIKGSPAHSTFARAIAHFHLFPIAEDIRRSRRCVVRTMVPSAAAFSCPGPLRGNALTPYWHLRLRSVWLYDAVCTLIMCAQYRHNMTQYMNVISDVYDWWRVKYKK